MRGVLRISGGCVRAARLSGKNDLIVSIVEFVTGAPPDLLLDGRLAKLLGLKSLMEEGYMQQGRLGLNLPRPHNFERDGVYGDLSWNVQ